MNDASKQLPTPRYFGEEFGTPLATWLNGEEQEAWGEWARSLEPMGFHMQGNAAIDRKARARITKVVEGFWSFLGQSGWWMRRDCGLRKPA